MTKKIKKLMVAPFALLLASCSNTGYYGFDRGFSNVYTPDGYMEEDTNMYTQITEIPFIDTEKENKSSFSLSSSTAAYTNIKTIIEDQKCMPSKDAVIIDQMVNYFKYNYTLEENNGFGIFNEVGECPWNSDHYLASVGIKAKEVEERERKTLNAVFLIDVSGSMSDDIRLIANAFEKLVQTMGSNDRVSIVTYSENIKVVLDGATASNKDKIISKIKELRAEGCTNGGKGIQKAYEIAKKNYIEGANNTIILATDGDFNVGISNEEDLKNFISEKRDSGIYLSILGFGMRNYRADFAETLAKNGNGNMFYINNQAQIDRLFEGGIASAFEVVAKDVKTQVVFDKELVRAYRLIGYENSLLSEEEYNNEDTDAGEILAGDATVAIYELILNDNANILENLFTTEVKYKNPDTNASCVANSQNSSYKFTPSKNFIFQNMVVEYGLVLRDSLYKENASLDNILSRYNEYRDEFDEDKDKKEFRILVEKTKEIMARDYQ